ncbi:MAG TPA: hypothetical protein VE129_14570 [Thermoanaerobaculia bacterium]|nr:hypothetical protein [Thermoanaerobaculia bacterium]
MHAVYATQNLYFLTPGKENLISLSRSARPFRRERKASLATFAEQGGDEGELLVYNSLSPNLGLRLSMLRTRKSADRVSLADRFERRNDSRRSLPTIAGKRFVLSGRVTRPLADE